MVQILPWRTITIDTPDELKDAIVGEFSVDGIRGVWEKPMEGSERTELVIYFDEDHLPPLAQARVGRVFERNGYKLPKVILGSQEQEDWIRNWRKGYTSFPIGTRFSVVPSWEDPEDAGVGRIVLGIDPGLAFGTGTHETTQMIMESLEILQPEGPVLDLGTGSGILAIAAAKLGFRVEVACDVDADAVHVAANNFRRNGIQVPLFVGSIDAVRSESIGLVLANLTGDAIGNLLFDICRVLGPGGRVVLSGVLDSQTLTLRAALAAEGYVIENESTRGEWVMMAIRPNGD